MHVSDDKLKVLIDLLAERLDDDKDMLSDCNALEERATVEMVWKVEELLEDLRQEQRSRTWARKQVLRDDSAPPRNPIGGQFLSTRSVLDLLKRLEKAEVLVAEHEQDRMAIRSELGAAQATIGDLLAQSNDHREQLNALRPDAVRCWTRVNALEGKLDSLGARDPDVMFWGRIKAFERKMEKWAREVGEVLDARTANAELSAEALLRLTRVTEELHRNLQALELQSDDRWVRYTQGLKAVETLAVKLENELHAHVGEGEVRH